MEVFCYFSEKRELVGKFPENFGKFSTLPMGTSLIASARNRGARGKNIIVTVVVSVSSYEMVYYWHQK